MRYTQLTLGLIVCASLTVTPVAAQRSDAILVLEVPVELRTISPEVVSVFVECTLYAVVQGGRNPIGTARTETRLIAGSWGGQVSEVAQVVFTLDHMYGDPTHGADYSCQIPLQTRDGTEAAAVADSDSTYTVPDSSSGITRARVVKVSFAAWRVMRTWGPGLEKAPSYAVVIQGTLDQDVAQALQQRWKSMGGKN